MAAIDEGETSLSEVEQVLTCQVCLNPLLGRTPRTLQCLHTFCTPCLDGIVTGNHISCPKCRQLTTLQGGDVSDLPLNFTIEQTNEMIRSLGMVELCNTCWVKGEFILATIKCRSCDRRLCETCVKEHNKYPGFQNHPMELLKLGSTKSASDFCKDHGSKHIHFCNACDILLCTDCLFSGKHGSHPDAVKEVSPIARQIRAKIQPREDNIKRRIKETKISLVQWRGLVEHFTEVRKEIEDAAIAIRKDLDDQIEGTLTNLTDKYLNVSQQGIIVQDKYLTVQQKAYQFTASSKSDCELVLSRRELEMNGQCLQEAEKTMDILMKPDYIKFHKDLNCSFGKIVPASQKCTNLPTKSESDLGLNLQSNKNLSFAQLFSDIGKETDADTKDETEAKPELSEIGPNVHLKGKPVIINRYHDDRMMAGFGIGALPDGSAVLVSRGGKGLLLYDCKKWLLSTYAASRTINRVSANSGRVLCVDGEEGMLFEVFADDKDLHFLKDYKITCSRHCCPSFDSKGNIIITPATENDSLRKYNQNEKLVWFKKLGCSFGQHVCAGTTKEGEMYIFSDSTRSEVRIWNDQGKYVCELRLQYGNLKPFPISTTITPYGTILVADKGNHTVSEYSFDGCFLRHLLTEDDGIRFPVGLSCDPSGLLWISEFEAGYGSHQPQNRLVIYQLQ